MEHHRLLPAFLVLHSFSPALVFELFLSGPPRFGWRGNVRAGVSMDQKPVCRQRRWIGLRLEWFFPKRTSVDEHTGCDRLAAYHGSLRRKSLARRTAAYYLGWVKRCHASALRRARIRSDNLALTGNSLGRAGFERHMPVRSHRAAFVPGGLNCSGFDCNPDSAVSRTFAQLRPSPRMDWQWLVHAGLGVG